MQLATQRVQFEQSNATLIQDHQRTLNISQHAIASERDAALSSQQRLAATHAAASSHIQMQNNAMAINTQQHELARSQLIAEAQAALQVQEGKVNSLEVTAQTQTRISSEQHALLCVAEHSESNMIQKLKETQGQLTQTPNTFHNSLGQFLSVEVFLVC